MGMDQVTTRKHPLVKVDAANNLLLIKGPVPGANGGIVVIRESIRLYKSKAEKAKAS